MQQRLHSHRACKKKNSNPLVPLGWKSVIAKAKINKPFLIFEIDQSYFKDIDFLELKKIRTSLNITKYVWMKMTEDDPVILCTRESHNLNHIFPANPNIFQYQDLSRLYSAPQLQKRKRKIL